MSKHITIGLFETSKTLCQTLAKDLQNLLEQHGLTKKTFLYVKDEVSNMNTVMVALKSKVNIIMKLWMWLKVFNAHVLNMPFF
jgi:glutathionylspermidine synthase